MSERNRIAEIYRARYEGDKRRYSLFNPGEHFMDVSFERELIGALIRNGIGDLGGLKILEIGCGDGRRLRNLQRLGSLPSDQHGIELLDFFVKDARAMSSNCNIIQGDAASLPYGDRSFDIVYQRTVFTSIFDDGLKCKIAAEMLRVLRPEGIVIWYDFFLNNPRNPDVRGVGKREIHGLFPGCEIELRKVTLAPPLARLCAPYSLITCQMLEKIWFLRTHYLGIIRKPA